MGIYRFRNQECYDVQVLKELLGRYWNDGKEELFGNDRRDAFLKFDPILGERFLQANERIEKGENADRVFFSFLYDDYHPPVSLYWKNESYQWRPEQEDEPAFVGVGEFILNFLWDIHPFYTFELELIKDRLDQDGIERFHLFTELMDMGAFVSYFDGFGDEISDKAKISMRTAQKQYEAMCSTKKAREYDPLLALSLYQTGFEVAAHDELRMNGRIFRSVDEVREFLKGKLHHSVNDFVSSSKMFMDAGEMDVRFYSYLDYMNQLNQFLAYYDIDHIWKGDRE